MPTPPDFVLRLDFQFTIPKLSNSGVTIRSLPQLKGFNALKLEVQIRSAAIKPWTGSVVYGIYATTDRLWGMSPEADQATAGAVMMIEGSLVTLAALAWLFLRAAREGELRQELLERGLDPRAVQRAVRYGRAEELHGRR